MSGRLWHDLSRWVWSWWMRDQIRASPAEGRLLRIQPGDLLTLGSNDVEVLDRLVTEGPAGLCIRLTCRMVTGTCELQLTMTDPRSPRLIWIEAGRSCPIAASDIQIWPRNRKIGNDSSRPSVSKQISRWNL